MPGGVPGLWPHGALIRAHHDRCGRNCPACWLGRIFGGAEGLCQGSLDPDVASGRGSGRCGVVCEAIPTSAFPAVPHGRRRQAPGFDIDRGAMQSRWFSARLRQGVLERSLPDRDRLIVMRSRRYVPTQCPEDSIVMDTSTQTAPGRARHRRPWVISSVVLPSRVRSR